MGFEDDLSRVNQRLKAGRLGVSIRLNGNRLVLRATLPPKPGTNHTKNRQYDLSLGHHANQAGLKSAEIEAKKLGIAISAQTFDWNDYLAGFQPKIGTVGEWVERFEEDYFSRNSRDRQSASTWVNYRFFFSKLPQDRDLNAEILTEAIKEFEPNSGSRRNVCVAASALAKFAGIELDVSQLKGRYSGTIVQPRDLPTDTQILEAWQGIPNKGWQFVYGLMATYGIRNHEAFLIDLDSLRKEPGILVILDGKTGPRSVWPCYPEWWETFRLFEPIMPNVNRKTHKGIGSAVCGGLGKYGIRKPYNLRHRWAVRTLEFGWPVELSARMQGHSVEIHTRTYQRFLREDTIARVWDLLVNRPDRPKPPTV